MNIPDVITIGLMAILALFIFHTVASGWSMFNLWRVTGSPALGNAGVSPGDVNLGDPALTSVEAT
jgi:hypothetical protein